MDGVKTTPEKNKAPAPAVPVRVRQGAEANGPRRVRERKPRSGVSGYRKRQTMALQETNS